MSDIKKSSLVGKDLEPSPKVPDFIITKKSETPLPLSPQEIERGREAIKKEIAEEPPSESEKRVGPASTQPTSSPPSLASHPLSSEIKSPALLYIESILEEDLYETFKQMDQAVQIRFKQEGERTARKIEQLIRQVKVKVKEILNLIRNWLKTIPDVNKYFIEQETKIKVDKIMALRK